MSGALDGIRNLSIRGKMLLGFAAVIGLVGLGNLYGIVSVSQIAARSLFARDVAFHKVVRLIEIESLARRMLEPAAAAVDGGISEQFAQAGAVREELDRKVDAAAAEFSQDRALARDFGELRGRIGEHFRQGDALLKLAAERQWSAFGQPRKAFEESQADILQRVGALKARSAAELEGSLLSITQLTRRTAWSVAGVTVLALVVALLMAIRLSGGIVRPLQRLIAMMKAAQSGDFSVRARVESQDETGALARGFNEMIQELQRHRNHLQELVEERTSQLDAAKQRLELELEVRQITESARAESEELLRYILNSVHAGILIVDAERHEIVEANAFALDRIGARREEVVGRRRDSYVCTAEGEVSPLPIDGSARENLKAQLRRADGRYLPILKSVVPITHQGRSQFIESFIDLSEAGA